MNNALLKSPYDDEMMTYDFKTHRYYLTRNAINYLSGGEVVYRNQKAEDRALRKTSELVYDYMFSVSNSNNRDFIVFVIACYEPYREIFKEVLMAQLEADMESGYNSMAEISPIDPQRNSTLNPNVIAQNLVSPRVKMKLENLNNPRLIYRGNLGWNSYKINQLRTILNWQCL